MSEWGLYFTYESMEEYSSQLRQELRQTMAGLLDGREPGFAAKDDNEASEYDPEVDHEGLQLSADIHREQDGRNIQRVVDHLEATDNESPYRVLDAGCGYGTVTKDRFGNDDRFDVIGIDHSKSVVKTARKGYAAPNIEYRWLDVNKLGNAGFGQFNLAFSSYLLHHIENQEPVLSLVWEHVDEGFVSIADAKAEIEPRMGDTGYKSQLSNVIEQTLYDGQYAKVDRRSGQPVMKLTGAGKVELFSQDTGSSASGGSDDHRIILQKSYEAFTKLGFITSLPTQEGDELADGIADLPIDPIAATGRPTVRGAPP